MPFLSLCSTNYNTSPITRGSLESVVAGVKGLDFEIVVVDNFSEDDSYATLTSLSHILPLKLVQRRCSRGSGRQAAYEISSGDWIVTFDLDTIYNENWKRLVRWVISNKPPFAISAQYSQFYPRWALERVRGWRDFQYWEDVDLWTRLAGAGLYRTYPITCGANLKRVPAASRVRKVTRLYARCRDKVAIADWVPFGLYFRAYLTLPRKLGLMRSLYHLSIFTVAYVAGRRKRKRLEPNYLPSILSNGDLVLDLGLVPREHLNPAATEYDSREGCEAALARGDIGFLPGTYD